MGQHGSRKSKSSSTSGGYSQYKSSQSASSLLRTGGGKQEVLLTFDPSIHSFSHDSESSLEKIQTIYSSDKSAQIYRFKHLTDKMTIKAVSSGKSFAALLSTDGKLFVCGKCPFPITGGGSETDSTNTQNDQNLSRVSIELPNDKGTVDEFSYIACGMYFMVAMSSDRSNLFSAGQNECGQRGIGRGGSLNFTPCIYDSSTSKTQFLSGMEKISCGYQHSIAFTKEGDVYGTGCSFQNQLGTIDSGICYEYRKISRPKTENRIVDIQAGFFFSACLDSEGMVYVTGIRAHSNIVDAQEWTKLKTFIDRPVSSMCISCSNSFFITHDGHVYHNLNLLNEAANDENLLLLNIPSIKSVFGKESFMAVDYLNRIHVSASNGSQGIPISSDTTGKYWFEHEGTRNLFSNSKDDLQIVDAFTFCIFIKSGNDGVLKNNLASALKRQFSSGSGVDLTEKNYFYDIQFNY